MDSEHTQQTRELTQKNSLGIPIAIVIAGALIAGSVYFSTVNQQAGVTIVDPNTEEEQVTPEREPFPPVTEADHIRGNIDAPIILVEYSDYECPFCKQFHGVMSQIFAEYGPTGEVAWVYRHFPLESLHPNAPKIALGAECVAEIGGTDAFWTYTDLIFNERSVNSPTDLSRIPEFLTKVGVDQTEFTTCVEEERYKEAVEEDFNSAVAGGGRGTPHTAIMVGEQQEVIPGSQPYDVMKKNIDAILTQLKETGEIE